MMVKKKRNREPTSRVAKHIGNRLRQLREEKKLTIRDVAALCEVSNPYVCQVENGQSVPSAEMLWKLAQGLGVDVEFFFQGLRWKKKRAFRSKAKKG